MSFAKQLKSLCEIQDKAETQGALGELSLVWSTKAANVRTRYSKAKLSEQRGGYQITTEDYKFYFEYTVAISVADQIVVDGQTFEVMHVPSDSSNHHKSIIARVTKFD